MAVKLTGNYAKRLGLPGYSSHQFSVSLETELTDLSQAQDEVSRLYRLLQDAVDREIQRTGFVPGPHYASTPPARVTTPVSNGGNGSGIRSDRPSGPFFSPPADNGNGGPEPWACSDKQRELILRLMDEHRLEEAHVEELARERFGAGLIRLNKLQASGLIDELLERCNSPRSGDAHAGTNGRRGGRR